MRVFWHERILELEPVAVANGTCTSWSYGESEVDRKGRGLQVRRSLAAHYPAARYWTATSGRLLLAAGLRPLATITTGRCPPPTSLFLAAHCCPPPTAAHPLRTAPILLTGCRWPPTSCRKLLAAPIAGRLLLAYCWPPVGCLAAYCCTGRPQLTTVCRWPATSSRLLLAAHSWPPP